VLMTCAVVMLAIAITKHNRLFAVGALVAAWSPLVHGQWGHSDRHVLPPKDPRGRTEFAPGDRHTERHSGRTHRLCRTMLAGSVT
jgi:hypothetical protein